jgi:hypothetical protein
MRAEYQTLDRLIILSEGGVLMPADEAALIERGPAFVQRTEIGYVVIDTEFISSRTRALVVQALKLREVSRDARLVLYVPETATP